MQNYFIGGLESEPEDSKILRLGGVDYVVNDKFKTMLRDSFIDWGTFLEVYHDNYDYAIMFDQISKLLNVKENHNLLDVMLPMVKKIYLLPANAHMSAMLRQFMIYEPMSISIHAVFNTVKHHFESIVERFVELRNLHINANGLKAKLNDWPDLINKWNDANLEYELESSSIVLLFLNPPKKIKKHVNAKLSFNVPGLEKEIKQLDSAISKFHYAGYCPKVAYNRLMALLTFPLREFCTVIKLLNPDEALPDYAAMEKEISELLKKKPTGIVITEEPAREKAPDSLVHAFKSANKIDDSHAAELRLIQWYVTKILQLRKELLPYGKKYENYYVELAAVIDEINAVIKKYLD